MTVHMPEPLKILAAELADDLTRRYAIDRDKALEAVVAIWGKDTDLLKATIKEERPERLRRMKCFKNAVKKSKTTIYYDLRRYRADDDVFMHAVERLQNLPSDATAIEVESALLPVAQSHVSTSERLPHREDFFDTLKNVIGVPNSILDIGCGVMPLIFPFDTPPFGDLRDSLTKSKIVESYCAADRDEKAIQVVQAYADWRSDERLVARHWELSEGWSPLLEASGRKKFDVAFMLKLIPVVLRRSPDLLDILADVPADKIVVTGSRQSMVKRQSIERREAGILLDFASKYGFEQTGDFETLDEIGFILEKHY
jgi:hypothetical protein